MNSLTLTLIRVAFLAVLWLFVIAAIGVVRTDLFGTAAAKVRRRPEPGTAEAAPAATEAAETRAAAPRVSSSSQKAA